MVGVNVGQKKIVEFCPSLRLHLPQEIGGDPFPRPHIRVGPLRRRNLERVLGGSSIDKNRRGIGTENESGIASTISEMMDVQHPWLPGLEDRLRGLRADDPGVPEFHEGGGLQECSSLHRRLHQVYAANPGIHEPTQEKVFAHDRGEAALRHLNQVVSPAADLPAPDVLSASRFGPAGSSNATSPRRT